MSIGGETLVVAVHTRLPADALTAIAVAFLERGRKACQIDVRRLGLGRSTADQEGRCESYCYRRLACHGRGQFGNSKQRLSKDVQPEKKMPDKGGNRALNRAQTRTKSLHLTHERPKSYLSPVARRSGSRRMGDDGCTRLSWGCCGIHLRQPMRMQFRIRHSDFTGKGIPAQGIRAGLR